MTVKKSVLSILPDLDQVRLELVEAVRREQQLRRLLDAIEFITESKPRSKEQEKTKSRTKM